MGTQEISVIQGDILATEQTFNAVLSDKSVVFQREAEFAIQVLSGNEYALKVALGNRQSVVNAVTNLAAIGLSLNPARKLAYLVPRDGKICLDVSYVGLTELAVASGSVRWVKSELVRANDRFELAGFGHPPSHQFNPFGKDRGDIVGVYCVAKTADGDYLTDTMAIDEVLEIRNRSSAWKAWISKQKKCPWVTDEGEMIKKGLALDTPIPTPSGWTSMGEIQEGDAVFDQGGNVVTVSATSEIKRLKCFKLVTGSGDEIICDDEHRWVARCGGSHASRKQYEVLTINEMFAAKSRGESVTIPVHGAIDLPDADLPIDPYLLGYWLGDGSASSAQFTVGSADLGSFKKAVRNSGYQIGKIRKDPRSDVYCVGVVDGFRAALKAEGLIGNKHVPAAYLRASIRQRKAILAGLMDSDGHITKSRGVAVFSNTRRVLSDAVYELCASLGEVPNMRTHKAAGFGVVSLCHTVTWKPTFCPCINQRKADNYKARKITPYVPVWSIEEVPTVPTRCIHVTGKSQTFLAGKSMSPTHNTIIKRASKMWPKTDRLDKAIHHLNVEGGEGLAEIAEQARQPAYEAQADDDRKQLPPVPEGYFSEKRVASWAATIASGANTIQGLIDFVGSKYHLAEHDIEFLRGVGQPQGESA